MNRLHRRNKRRRIFWSIITVGAIGFFLYLMIGTLFKDGNLKNNRNLTTGIITGTFNNQRNTGSGVYYTFYSNNKLYKGSIGYPELSTAFCESLIGRSFPVIYSPADPTNNKMLLTKQTFIIYRMEQPDSLKWIEEYVR